MASQSLAVLLNGILDDPQALRARWIHPVIVWEPPRKATGLIDVTDVTGTALSLERGEPMVIEVVKGAFANAFPFGVTIGHAENNDVVLRHHLVSRFHAYVKVVDGKRCLVDAASRNGTWLDGQRLVPTRPVPLPPQAAIKLGGPSVTWLEPERLASWLWTRVQIAKDSHPVPWTAQLRARGG
jgi:pSer/pThr/pTyr-binding forkhead associated (FHA) protein